MTNGCSGFRGEAYWDLNILFNKHKNLFQAAYQYENYIWTHAGINKGWYEYRFPYKSPHIADDLNKAFLENNSILYDVGHSRGGFKDVGGIFWSDKIETWYKPLPNYHQIVGHTRIDEITTRTINNTTSITYIDVLENNKTSQQYYVLEI